MKTLLWIMPLLLMVGARGHHRYAFYKADMSSFAPDDAECGAAADSYGAKSVLLRGRDWGTYMQCMKLRGYQDANP